MQLQRDEAQIFLNMIDASSGAIPDGSMTVIEKISKTYPDIIRGTKYTKLLADWLTAREKVKKSAMAQISELLESANASVQEATRIAKAAGVGFDLYIGDPDQSQYFDPREGWNASNC